MKIIAILLIIVGVLCLAASTVGFGDIGLAFAAIGIVAILSGIGFLLQQNRYSKPNRRSRQ